MANGRTYDEDIADVFLQAIADGAVRYEDACEVVREQADMRVEELGPGATADEIDREHKRWAGFGRSNITKWKMDNPDFERELMELQDLAAQDQIKTLVLDYADEMVEIAKDGRRTRADRRLIVYAMRHALRARAFAVEMRLSQRRWYHRPAEKSGQTHGIVARVVQNERFMIAAESGKDKVN